MYSLPSLPYLFQDLEPYIDTHTMGLHYHKHQQNYINHLNEILIKNHYNFQYSPEELIFHVDEFPKEVQNDLLFNLGGYINHNLFWKSIYPLKQLPTGKLLEQITKQYHDITAFLSMIKSEALSLKGSGYVFLVTDATGNLQIMALSNQETPLSKGLYPLFTIDMWEHAYYLNYKNNKAEYIDNLFEIIDFSFANQQYQNLV